MRTRQERLNNLTYGDIVYAKDGTRGIILFIEELSDSEIFARSITTQEKVTLSAETGIGRDGKRIVSIEPLPIHFHHVIVGLDRKIRLGGTDSSNPMNKEEIWTLFEMDKFYDSYPLLS